MQRTGDRKAEKPEGDSETAQRLAMPGSYQSSSAARVSWSVQAAITKYHRLGGLRNRTLFLTILEAGKSKIKVPAR